MREWWEWGQWPKYKWAAARTKSGKAAKRLDSPDIFISLSCTLIPHSLGLRSFLVISCTIIVFHRIEITFTLNINYFFFLSFSPSIRPACEYYSTLHIALQSRVFLRTLPPPITVCNCTTLNCELIVLHARTHNISTIAPTPTYTRIMHSPMAQTPSPIPLDWSNASVELTPSSSSSSPASRIPIRSNLDKKHASTKATVAEARTTKLSPLQLQAIE